MADFHTKFWILADAVVSAKSISDAWEKLEHICKNAIGGNIPSSKDFYSGSMSVEPDGAHLSEPAKMTEAKEHRLIVMFHDKVIKQAEHLALEEAVDPFYSMILGFALAHDLRYEDARKLAQRLYKGKEP